jgi:hypothetical protein
MENKIVSLFLKLTNKTDVIMKTRKNNWIVKVTYVNEEYQYVVKHINVLDSTKEEVLRYAQSLGNCSTVCVYKLEAIL